MCTRHEYGRPVPLRATQGGRDVRTRAGEQHTPRPAPGTEVTVSRPVLDRRGLVDLHDIVPVDAIALPNVHVSAPLIEELAT